MIDVIHRRSARQFPVQLPGGVDGAKQSGRVLHHGDIGAVDSTGKGLAAQGVGIEHNGVMASCAQFFHNRLCGGVVPASGATRENQRVHTHFTSICSLCSLLICSRNRTTPEMTKNPIQMAGIFTMKIMWTREQR